MLRKRNLVALLLAAVLSVGTMGVALADDSGADLSPIPHGTSIQDDSGADFVPVPSSPDVQFTAAGVWL